MTIDWPTLVALADNTPSRLVKLSPMSKTLIDTAFSFLSKMSNYNGAGYEKTDAEIDEIKASVDKLMIEIERAKLIGVVMPYINTVPEGTLKCDGSTYNREDYPYLFDYLIGTALILDADTFLVPVIQDRFVLAAGGTFPRYTAGGEINHTLTLDEIPAHTHTAPIISIIPDLTGEIPSLSSVQSGSTGSAGGGNSHNNMPPYVSLEYCIVSG